MSIGRRTWASYLRPASRAPTSRQRALVYASALLLVLMIVLLNLGAVLLRAYLRGATAIPANQPMRSPTLTLTPRTPACC